MLNNSFFPNEEIFGEIPRIFDILSTTIVWFWAVAVQNEYLKFFRLMCCSKMLSTIFLLENDQKTVGNTKYQKISNISYILSWRKLSNTYRYCVRDLSITQEVLAICCSMSFKKNYFDLCIKQLIQCWTKSNHSAHHSTIEGVIEECFMSFLFG